MSRAQKAKDNVYAVIMGRAMRYSIRTVTELSERLGFVRQTLANKMNKPRTMTVGELHDISEYLQLSDDEIMEIIRSSKT